MTDVIFNTKCKSCKRWYFVPRDFDYIIIVKNRTVFGIYDCPHCDNVIIVGAS